MVHSSTLLRHPLLLYPTETSLVPWELWVTRWYEGRIPIRGGPAIYGQLSVAVARLPGGLGAVISTPTVLTPRKGLCSREWQKMAL
jgi:hypothetical protein